MELGTQAMTKCEKEELMIDLLKKKKHGRQLPYEIPERDIYACHPKILQGSPKECCYFTELKHQHERGTKFRRTVEGVGVWKHCRTDTIEVKNGQKGQKTLFNFYEGKVKGGNPTGWTMHEYSDLDGTTTANGCKIVLCTIHENVKKGCTTSPSTSAIIEVGDQIMNQLHPNVYWITDYNGYEYDMPKEIKECPNVDDEDNPYWNALHDGQDRLVVYKKC